MLGFIVGVIFGIAIGCAFSDAMHKLTVKGGDDG